MHPARVIPREPAGSNDTVNVGVMLQLLIPGVEDTEETDLSAQTPGIRGDLHQCLGTGAEEQAVNHFFVLQCQRGQVMGEREGDIGRRASAAVRRVALRASARAPGSGTWGSAGYGMSYRRWHDCRSRSTDPDGLPWRRCGTARWLGVF